MAQLENRARRERVVVCKEDIAAIGDVLVVERIVHVAVEIRIREEETIEREAAKDALLLTLSIVDANVELLSVVGIETGKIEISDVIRPRSGVIWLRVLGGKLLRNWIQVGRRNDVAIEGLPCSVFVVRFERVVNGIGIRRKISSALRKSGDRECATRIELLLLSCLVIAFEEEFLVENRAAE